MTGQEPRWGLNPSQWAAASTTEGNLGIRAGAGTGKTWSLVGHYLENLLYATGPNGEEPSIDSIVAITYTKAAAGELRTRIAKVLREDFPELERQLDGAWISTIHSFCARVLRAEAAALTGEMATDPLFILLEPEAAASLRRQAAQRVLEEYCSSSPEGAAVLFGAMSRQRVISGIIDTIEECNTHGFSCDALVFDFPGNGWPHEARVRAAGSEFISLAQQVAREYEAEKRARGSLDFSDVILRVNQLFSVPSIASRYRNHFTRILIDEFQDTNQVQFEIFRKISRSNITVVGDRNQSIYSFQGARVEVFDQALSELTEESTTGQTVSLDVNYRSDERILRFVNKVFTAEQLFGQGGLVALRAPGESAIGDKPQYELGQHRVKVMPIPIKKSDLTPVGGSTRVEAEWIASEFDRMHREGGVPLADMVVALRARTHASVFVAALNARGIPARVVGGKGLLKDPVVREARALLRVLDNPADEPALVAALISSFGCVTDQDLVEIVAEARNLRTIARERDLATMTKAEEIAESSQAAMWRACVMVAGREDRCSAQLTQFVEAVSHAQSQLGALPIDAILHTLIDQLGVEWRLTKSLPSGARNYTGEQSFANLVAFAALAGRWEAQGGTLRAFEADIEDRVSARDTMKVAPVPDTAGEGQASGVDGPVEGEQSVRIVTVHETKGLEYPVVAYAVGEDSVTGTSKPILCRVLGHAGMAGSEVRVGLRVTLLPEEVDACSAMIEDGDLSEVAGITSPEKTVYRFEMEDFTAAEKARLRAEMAETLRRHYVACTRAEQLLLISYFDGSTTNDPDRHSHYRLGSAIRDGVIGDKAEEGIPGDWAETVEVADALTVVEALSAGNSGSHVEEHRGELSKLPSSDDGHPTSHSAVAYCADEDTGVVRAPGRRITQVSPTHISVAEACPWQYHLRFDRGLGTLRDTSTASPTARGDAVHAMLEYAWVHSTLPADTAERILSTHQIPLEYHAEVLDQANKVLGTETLEQVRSAGSAQAESQQYLQVEAAGGRVFLYGIIDMLAGWETGEALVVDYKSGKGSAHRAKYEAQARCYALAAMARGYSSVRIRFLMPGGEELSALETVDRGVPFHEYHFSAADRDELADWILERVQYAEKAGLITPSELEREIPVETCLNCGYAGPFCEVGSLRK